MPLCDAGTCGVMHGCYARYRNQLFAVLKTVKLVIIQLLSAQVTSSHCLASIAQSRVYYSIKSVLSKNNSTLYNVIHIRLCYTEPADLDRITTVHFKEVMQYNNHDNMAVQCCHNCLGILHNIYTDTLHMQYCYDLCTTV
jgi:hypothetical protein